MKSFMQLIIAQSLLVILTQSVWSPQLLAAENETKPTVNSESRSPADLIRAEAEKMKAEAEIEKNEVERAKIDVDLKRVADAREQFYLSFFSRVALAVVVIAFILWLTPRVLPRLRKVGIAGIFQADLSEDLKKAWIAFHDLGQRSAVRDLTDISTADSPRHEKQLTGPGKYQYERLSHRLYRLFYDVEDPNQLDSKSRDQFRELLKEICTTATAIGHYSKALDIILHLQQFTDRALDDEELLMIGNAYMWASLDDGLATYERKSYLAQAVPFFQAAYRIAEDPERKVNIAYNLGWTLLASEDYSAGARWMETSVKLDKNIAPWANWAVACGQVKQAKVEQALITLDSIPEGTWWREICKDEDFSEVKKDLRFKDRFENLCAHKINSKNQGDLVV